jgi:hypothetical protein
VPKDRKILVIDRTEWMYGGDNIDRIDFKGFTSALCNDRGMMSSIGIYCNQPGKIDLGIIMGVPEPCDLIKVLEPAEADPAAFEILGHLTSVDPETGIVLNSHFTNTAPNLNNDEHLTKVEREERIADHFTTIGVVVLFEHIDAGNNLKRIVKGYNIELEIPKKCI